MRLDRSYFRDANRARAYLEAKVWPNGRFCPHCGSISDGHYKVEGETTRPGLYKCKECHQPFTVTVGTLFDSSKVPLNVWLHAISLLRSSKTAMRLVELKRILGPDFKTVRLMKRRIRAAMANAKSGKRAEVAGIPQMSFDEALKRLWASPPPHRRKKRNSDRRVYF